MAQVKTPAMVLQELCTKKSLPTPTYEVVDSETGTHSNRFDYKVTIGNIVGMGTGSSKQISKHEAALDALMVLKEMGIYNPIEMPTQEFKPDSKKKISPTTSQAPVFESPLKGTPNCIGPLKDLCYNHKIPDPVFKMINEDGPPHSKNFTFECQVASLITVATSSTKKLAKQLAAQEMMEKVKMVLPEIAGSLSETPPEPRLAIKVSEKDAEMLELYNKTYGSITTNKTCKIAEFPFTLRKLLDNQGKTYKDICEDLELRTIEGLNRITEMLELEYEFLEMQENPWMVAFILKIDTPFTTIGMGDTFAKAKSEALNSAFDMMKCFFLSEYQ